MLKKGMPLHNMLPFVSISLPDKEMRELPTVFSYGITCFIAFLLIIFVLTHKKLEKKLDLTILIVVATTLLMVNVLWVWVTIFFLTCLYVGIKYRHQSKKD